MNLVLYNLRGAMSTTFLKHFYNKSWVVSYYLFKFEFGIDYFFNPIIITSNNLPLRICYKIVVDVSFPL